MYRDSSLIVEHRFNVIAEVKRYGPISPPVMTMCQRDVPTLARPVGRPARQHGRRWMT